MDHPLSKVQEAVDLVRRTSQVQYQQLVQFVEEVNQKGGAYHRFDFGQGLIVQGDYDMSKYIHYYNLPTDLKGKKVLDIGTSSGFFALECACRGGQVTAIDIWDWVTVQSISKLINVDVSYVKQSLYNLDPGFGQFDLVICGSVLPHLPDPFGAIQRIKSVCSGRAVVATPRPRNDNSIGEPICEFIGKKASDGDYYHYWALGAKALENMLLTAGFSRVEQVQQFTLSTEVGRTEYAEPHVVMTGVI